MSENDSCNRSLAAVGRAALAPVGGQNPLIARGLADLAPWVGASISAPATSTAPLKLEINIAGLLSLRPATGGLSVVLAKTPGVIEFGPKMLAEAHERLVKGHEEKLFKQRQRFEKLCALNAPDVILQNEMRLVSRWENNLNSLKKLSTSQDDYIYSFETHHMCLPRSEVDQGVATVLQLKQLDSLDLYACPVTDRGLDRLRGHSNLSVLSLNSCVGITDEGLRHLAGLTALEELGLAGCPVTDKVLSRLAGLKRLEKLNLASCSITDNGLMHLRGLTDLRTLYISKYNDFNCPPQYCVGAIPGAEGGHGVITDGGLAHLSALTQLEELELRKCFVTDNGLAHLSTLTQLEELDLTGCPVTGWGLGHLGALTGLRRLFLGECPLTDSELMHLGGHPELGVLHLGSPLITDSGLVHLKGLTHLEELGFSRCALTDRGLAHLSDLKNLRSLSFLGCDDITPNGVAALRAALPQCEIS